MSEEHAPDEVYEAVARDRFVRWGYDKTLGEESRGGFVADEARDFNLRADADVVWRLAKAAP